MIIKPTILKKMVKDKTGFQVSTNGLYILIDKAEEFLREKIVHSGKLLQERNELRKIQGLKPKKRINEELIEEVLNE